MSAKPFIKWVGGKTQLLEEINNNLPKDLNNIETYIEPFIGGGAVMFDIVPKLSNVKNVIICDLNYKLTNVYAVIKHAPETLIKKLKEFESKYYEFTLDGKEKMFYDVRSSFNKYELCLVKDYIDRAAEFIFLNKTCFNGLYRENKKGEFNVPWNKSKKPTICDEENINDVHDFLITYNVTILTGPYFKALQKLERNTLVYFDPPYRPITKSSAFTAYTKSGFNDSDQVLLRDYCDGINDLNSYFMLSNSDPKNSDPNDEFFDKLYSDYNIKRVSARRNINSKGNSRGEVTEILVKNFN